MTKYVFACYLKSAKDPKLSVMSFNSNDAAKEQVTAFLNSVDVDRVEVYETLTVAQKEVVVHWS